MLWRHWVSKKTFNQGQRFKRMISRNLRFMHVYTVELRMRAMLMRRMPINRLEIPLDKMNGGNIQIDFHDHGAALDMKSNKTLVLTVDRYQIAFYP